MRQCATYAPYAPTGNGSPPRPARARRTARALGQARGRSRWTVDGVDGHAIRVARKTFAHLCMALSGKVGRRSSPVRKPLARANRRRAAQGRGGRRGTRRRSPARRPVAATDRPGHRRRPRLRGPRREGRSPRSPGKREAVGLSASGLLPRPKCATTEHRGKWKPGRERSMSCWRGHGPWRHYVHPYPPPHGHCPVPRPYAPPPEPRVRAADAETSGTTCDSSRTRSPGFGGTWMS
ncbi:hypothetical protein ACVW19_002842 [Streptomyces sp. TE5632]